MRDSIRRLLSYYEVNKSIKLTFAIVVPALLASHLGYFEEGIALGSGAFLVGITDSPGLLRHKLMGNGLAASVMLLAFLGIAYFSTFKGFIVLAFALLLFSFLLSMISVYGARANGIAFSGLISMVLSLAVIGENRAVEMAFLHFAGGIGYLIFSVAVYRVRPYFQVFDALAICIRSTADYFSLRSALYNLDVDSLTLEKDLTNKEMEIYQSHELVRELLLKKRAALSGKSSLSRSLVLLFTELVDLMELGMATTFSLDSLSQEERSSEIIQSYKFWLLSVSKELGFVELALRKGKISSPPQHMRLAASKFYSLKKRKGLRSQGLGEDAMDSGFFLLVLESMSTFVGKISTKLEMIVSATNLQLEYSGEEIQSLNLVSFQSRENYSWHRLVDNLSISSNFFRYSIRLSFSIFTAFCLTQILAIQNPYWVLLTIIVILRPAYGLTKTRMRHRTIGTAIGGTIALLILSLNLPDVLLISLLSLSIFLSFVYNARDYKIGVLFTTLFVIFLYALMEPDFYSVVQLRVLDTLIGVVFAWLFNAYFFTASELPQLRKYFKISLIANQSIFKYLSMILLKHQESGIINEEVKYKILRKEASIAHANLNAAIQRYISEPRFRQWEKIQWQELVSINHAFFLAVLGLHSLIEESDKTNEVTALDLEILHAIDSCLTGQGKNTVYEKNLWVGGAESSPPTTELRQALNWILNISMKLRAGMDKYTKTGLIPNFSCENK